MWLARYQGLVEVIELFLRMEKKGDSPSALPELNFSPSLPPLFELPFGGQEVRVFSCSRRRGGPLKALDASLRITDRKAQLDDLLS
jgi:hypothetical protein